MVHHFDLALWYFARHGDPGDAARARQPARGRDAGLFDNVSILFRYANGAYVTINQCVAGLRAQPRRSRSPGRTARSARTGRARWIATATPTSILRGAAERASVRARRPRVRADHDREIGRGVRVTDKIGGGGSLRRTARVGAAAGRGNACC
jgi:predicted dehydrogenase